jgi:hypothetical protein
MDPHPIPSEGLFFEGWYLRLTDRSGISIGGLAASWHAGEEAPPQGYVAIFSQLDQTSRLSVSDRVFEAMPAVTSQGASVTAPPDASIPSRFHWEIPDVARVTEQSMDLTTLDANGGKTRFQVSLGAPVLWNPDDIADGPEGAWADNFALKGHWFVHSIASPAAWTIQTPSGKKLSGEGLAHFEKNWGASFPKKWMWAQGIDPVSGASFVIAGGENPVFPALLGGAWLVGIRVPGENALRWNIATGRLGHRLAAQAIGCDGFFSIKGSHRGGKAEIEISAPRASFGPMMAPTPQGFEPLSEQSFVAEAILRLTPVDGQTREIRIPRSALEFGGTFRCDE